MTFAGDATAKFRADPYDFVGATAAIGPPMEKKTVDTALVHRIAGALLRHMPAHVDRDELISLGYMGLVEAQARFDPDRGVPFSAFAAGRIRGAMLDWLRQLDPVSRDERARLRATGEQASVRLVDFAHADNRPAPGPLVVDELLDHERRQLLWRALGRLSARHRQVVQRYFFDEVPLRTIGEELGVTESRVCQIVGEIVARLRTMLADESTENVAEVA